MTDKTSPLWFKTFFTCHYFFIFFIDYVPYREVTEVARIRIQIGANLRIQIQILSVWIHRTGCNYSLAFLTYDLLLKEKSFLLISFIFIFMFCGRQESNVYRFTYDFV